jgi:hypothetical protein
MKRVMNNRWLVILMNLLILVSVGCNSNNSSSRVEETNEKQDISGVWVGYIGSFFTVGIINKDESEKYLVQLVAQDNFGQYKQFISPDGAPLIQQTLNFTGNLEALTWDTTGPDYNYSTLSPRSLFLWFTALGGRQIGPFGGFFYEDNKKEIGQLLLIYNTTYDVSPNVNNIGGQWEIKNAILKDNTIVLTITPNAADTKGAVILAHDNQGNIFDGTIVIHYSTVDKIHKNVYDVNLTLNNTINLSGLAAYVLESSTEGIAVSKKTLAIGATNKDRTYSFSGLAEFIK